MRDVRRADAFSADLHALATSGHYERLYLDLYRMDPKDIERPAHRCLALARQEYPYLQIGNANILSRRRRAIKQPCEIAALRQAEAITREGILAMMRASKPVSYTHLDVYKRQEHDSVKELAIEFLLYGAMAEIFARKTGFNRGLGGSMHTFFTPFGIYPNNAIVGGSAGIAAGAALFKRVNLSLIHISRGSPARRHALDRRPRRKACRYRPRRFPPWPRYRFH